MKLIKHIIKKDLFLIVWMFILWIFLLRSIAFGTTATMYADHSLVLVLVFCFGMSLTIIGIGLDVYHYLLLNDRD